MKKNNSDFAVRATIPPPGWLILGYMYVVSPFLVHLAAELMARSLVKHGTSLQVKSEGDTHPRERHKLHK